MILGNALALVEGIQRRARLAGERETHYYVRQVLNLASALESGLDRSPELMHGLNLARSYAGRGRPFLAIERLRATLRAIDRRDLELNEIRIPFTALRKSAARRRLDRWLAC
ncbi:hypothetical protein [Caballeronia insecticola]|uniref:Uncharacterized protein n=1 Tax=Caballeronia insecticola TaxID=758793 RepID=A0A060PHD3_9BURK|nr:hypothetical protein [Caballeronia insecticola]BAO94182.1 hypothetical protein BRPE64_ECDS03000 [Caballeronia insecticola]